MTINKRQDEVIEEFEMFDDWMDKYEYLISLGKELPLIDASKKVEENIRFTKLVFPIKNGEYWNGNAYNDLLFCEYTYDSIHEPYELNSFSFDSTVTVLQKDLYTAVDYQNAYEVYAKNVGLIYKKDINLSINLYNIINRSFSFRNKFCYVV